MPRKHQITEVLIDNYMSELLRSLSSTLINFVEPEIVNGEETGNIEINNEKLSIIINNIIQKELSEHFKSNSYEKILNFPKEDLENYLERVIDLVHNRIKDEIKKHNESIKPESKINTRLAYLRDYFLAGISYDESYSDLREQLRDETNKLFETCFTPSLGDELEGEDIETLLREKEILLDIKSILRNQRKRSYDRRYKLHKSYVAHWERYSNRLKNIFYDLYQTDDYIKSLHETIAHINKEVKAEESHLSNLKTKHQELLQKLSELLSEVEKSPSLRANYILNEAMDDLVNFKCMLDELREKSTYIFNSEQEATDRVFNKIRQLQSTGLPDLEKQTLSTDDIKLKEEINDLRKEISKVSSEITKTTSKIRETKEDKIDWRKEKIDKLNKKKISLSTNKALLYESKKDIDKHTKEVPHITDHPVIADDLSDTVNEQLRKIEAEITSRRKRSLVTETVEASVPLESKLEDTNHRVTRLPLYELINILEGTGIHHKIVPSEKTSNREKISAKVKKVGRLFTKDKERKNRHIQEYTKLHKKLNKLSNNYNITIGELRTNKEEQLLLKDRLQEAISNNDNKSVIYQIKADIEAVNEKIERAYKDYMSFEQSLDHLEMELDDIEKKLKKDGIDIDELQDKIDAQPEPETESYSYTSIPQAGIALSGGGSGGNDLEVFGIVQVPSAPIAEVIETTFSNHGQTPTAPPMAEVIGTTTTEMAFPNHEHPPTAPPIAIAIDTPITSPKRQPDSPASPSKQRSGVKP